MATLLSLATPIDPFLHSNSDGEVMTVIVRWFIEQEVIVMGFQLTMIHSNKRLFQRLTALPASLRYV